MSKKIAIIGGGAAGLSAAHFLIKKGVDVTVFEKTDSVGGQVSSVEVDNRWYEMGAVVGLNVNRAYYKFIKDVNVETILLPGKRRAARYIGRVKQPKRSKLLALSLIYYQLRYPAKLRRPGYKKFSGSGAMSSDFLMARYTKAFSDAIAPFYTAYGYGYLNEIPIDYFLKHFDYDWIFGGRASTKFYGFPGGYQNLWRGIAKNLTVKLNTQISEIRRSSECVTIKNNEQEEQFDGLLIACGPQNLIGVIDYSEQEESIFTSIRSYDYRAYLCKIEKPLNRSVFLFPERTQRSGEGHPVLIVVPYYPNNIICAYAYAGEKSDDEIEKNIANTLEEIGGGKLLDIIHGRYWNYFPHFSGEFIKNGVYQKLDQLQGKNRTLMVGEIFNFSTVWKCVEWSQHLIDSKFEQWEI